MTPHNPEDMGRLKALLEPIYRAGRSWQYSEEVLLLQIMRSNRHYEDAQIIVQWFETLPATKRQWFPQSMMSLLTRWEELLDRIAIAGKSVPEPAAFDRIMASRELDRVEKRIKTIRDSYESHSTWDNADKVEIKKLKERRDVLVKQLNFLV